MDDDATIYLAKAVESLQTAESEFANGRYNCCANRCHYACFQAAIAALMCEGIQPRGRWTHESVQAQFAGQLINRRKRFSAGLGHVLPDNQTLRVEADYRPKHVTDTQAGRALRKARMFVNAIQQRSETH
ncbi:MAG: HEPN domain-containing protein [Thermomicrobiales bacterium]